MPTSAVIDRGGLLANLGARLSDIILIAFPACFGSMGRKNKSQRGPNPVIEHFFKRVAEERLGVAHTDVDRQRVAAFIQDILKRFRLAKSDFVERRLAADGFVVVDDFFKPLRRYWNAFGDSGKKRANLFRRSRAAKGDQ